MLAVDNNSFVGGTMEEKRRVSIQGEINYEEDFFFHCPVRAAKACFALSAMINCRLILSSQIVICVPLAKSFWKINQYKAVHLATL